MSSHYNVTIRDTKTGYTRIYEEDYAWPSPTDGLFQWLKNNFSCDCNRGMFLYENSDDPNDYDCGDTRFVIDQIQIRETGEILDLRDVSNFFKE